MDFNEYQKQARKTAIYPDVGNNFQYPTIGLCGEAGEVAEKVKKIIRDRSGKFDAQDVTAIKKELGDVLWYLANLAAEFNLDFESIAKTNIRKLKERTARNKLHGSGDDR